MFALLKSSRDLSFCPTNQKKNCCCISNPCDWDLTTTQLTVYPCGSNPNPANLWRGLSPNNCAGPCSTTSMKNWERGVYCDSWEHSLSSETAVNIHCLNWPLQNLFLGTSARAFACRFSNISSVVGSLWAQLLGWEVLNGLEKYFEDNFNITILHPPPSPAQYEWIVSTKPSKISLFLPANRNVVCTHVDLNSSNPLVHGRGWFSRAFNTFNLYDILC